MSKKDLSPVEFELMEILWDRGEATAREIQEALGQDRRLASTTIATLLSRMQKKGCLVFLKGKHARVYRPSVTRNQVIKGKLAEVIKRFLGDDISPLLSYIAEDRGLSAEELKALENIVKSAEED